MLEHVFRSHERIQALREGPHSSLLEGFAEELHQTGYARKLPARASERRSICFIGRSGKAYRSRI